MSNQTEFKRLNFFKGFFTQAEDWEEGQAYHIEKRKLLQRGLHRPGIIQGLEVRQHPAGGLNVQVKPGVALDGEGNLIVLAAALPVAVTLPDPLPSLVYVAIEFKETETDYVANAMDPDYSGYSRVTEQAVISIQTSEPDHQTRLELARIALGAGVTGIVDPADPDNPQVNEIDRRQVRRAGSVDHERDKKLDALQERLEHLHAYHLEKQRRHNRGLFRAGIMRSMLDRFRVVPAGGLTVQVKPGVALDGEGNQVYLDSDVPITLESPAATTRVYVAARYQDAFADYVKSPDRPFAGTYRTAEVGTLTTMPDNHTWLELARLDVEAGATEVRLPVDPGHPQPNEIDRRSVEWAAALAVVAPKLPTALRQRIAQLMRDKRRDFAALAARFPVPSATDVRQAALNLETLARNDSLKHENLREVLTMLETLEQDVGQEIGETYLPVLDKAEYQDYVAAVAALRNALYAGESIDTILTCQATVTMAARELAEVAFRGPLADAGPDQTVTSTDDEATVTLDASQSQASGGSQIINYHWEKEQ